MLEIKFKNKSGQMIVEAMIAISIATAGLFGVMALLSKSIGLNRVIANHYIANNLAAEGIEIIKYKIDKNYLSGGLKAWDDGLLESSYEVNFVSVEPSLENSSCDNGRELYFNSGTGLYNYVSTNKRTSFKRCVSIEAIESDGDRVGLDVS